MKHKTEKIIVEVAAWICTAIIITGFVIIIKNL